MRGMSFETSCRAKEAGHERPYSIRFRVYRTSKPGTFIETESRSISGRPGLEMVIDRLQKDVRDLGRMVEIPKLWPVMAESYEPRILCSMCVFELHGL